MPRLISSRKAKEKSALRAWLRATWKGGLHFIEYNMGGDAGLSDAQLYQTRRITPVELKTIRIGLRKGSVGLFNIDLRDGQSEYHSELIQYGIGSIFIGMTSDQTVFGTTSIIIVHSGDGSVQSEHWRHLLTHDDIEELVEDSWTAARKPRLVGGTHYKDGEAS